MTTTTWTFADGFEGWTFVDDSTVNAQAFRTHVTGAIRSTMDVDAAAGTRTAIGLHSSPIIGVVATGGDQIQLDYGAASNPIGSGDEIILTAIYTDTTESSVSTNNFGAATLTRTLIAGKTLDYIRITNQVGFSGFSPGATYDSFRDWFEVRLTTVNPVSGLFLTRPLGIDVGLETGAKIWTTFWRNGTLYLREYTSALIAQIAIQFGLATEAQVDNRTFYLSPYTPPFFGTANLDDIIYVYGRWDDGAVTHIEKSTDGGSSFSDIGDSGTWGAGWVGGFFADDANTLYAFVNGGSRALYRSIDAGSTWTNLSSMPFDVDPGGVSKHPDGRILISNRDAGAQTAAYAEAPDYSSWIDATGSPSFPVSTPGSGSNSIIWIT